MKKIFLSLLTTSILLSAMSNLQAQSIDQIKSAAKSAGYSEAEINTVLGQTAEQQVVAQPTVIDDSPIDRGTQVEAETKQTTNRPTSNIYGHNLYSTTSNGFIPNFNIPTPSNYKLASGDEVLIDIWGSTSMNYSLTIIPEGSINVPGIGPIYINGLTIEEAKTYLKNEFSKIFSDLKSSSPKTFINVRLGKLRSMIVNVVGEVSTPGAYTLPSLSTLNYAIYSAGGITPIGTVREIKLYRDSKLVTTFDTYDFIFNGDFSKNIRLEDNDVIKVDIHKTVVSIRGNVKRPMRYELKNGQTINDVIKYAGGFGDNAYTEKVNVVRTQGEMRTTYTIDKDKFKTFTLVDGDIITVTSNLDRFKNMATVSGAVFFPGPYAISDSISTVSELINAAGGFAENAYMDEAIIRRIDEKLQPVTVDFKPSDIANGTKDIELQMNDEIIIKTIEEMFPTKPITISGYVNSPNTFEYSKGMTLKSLVLMADGLAEGATQTNIKINRRIWDERTQTTPDTVAVIYTINLLENPKDADFLLRPYDIVHVNKSPSYIPQQVVTVSGEVNFPGNYVVEKNTVRISDVINKANGLTQDANAKGASLTRRYTTHEARTFNKTNNLLLRQRQLADTSLIFTNMYISNNETYDVAINLEKALAEPEGSYDLILQEGDVITIPKLENTVKIEGAVMYPNAVTYNEKMSLKDYVKQAGGFNENAAKRKAYIVYANGTIDTRSSAKIEPGCQIIVPYKPIKQKDKLSAVEWVTIASSLSTLTMTLITIINTVK